MKEIRFITILITGGLSAYLTYQSQYHLSPFDGIVLFILLVCGIFILFWTLLKDITRWRERVARALFLIDGTYDMRTSILREIAQGLPN